MRRLHRVAATLGVATIGLFGFQAVAGAASGYPGGTTSNGSSAVVGPNQLVATSFSGTLCGFAPGTVFNLYVNGTVDAQGTAASNGCVTFTGVVTDPHLALNGGTPVPVNFGSNVVSAIGTSSLGGTQSDTYTFDIVEASAASAASAAGAGLAFTGADIAGMSVAGLALIAFGFLVLRFSRRRTLAS